MVWWILLAVIVVAVAVWFVRRRNDSHADMSEVTQVRGQDEGRGFGPTGY